MTRPFLLLFFFFGVLVPSFAQQHADTIYFDSNGKIANNTAAEYYTVIFPKEDGLCRYEQHYVAENVIKETGYYRSKDSLIRSGHTVSYDARGFKIADGFYHRDMKYGKWKMYYPHTDTLRVELNYSDNILDGDLISYYRSGKLKREETYVSGRSAGGKCYGEDGKEIPFTEYYPFPKPVDTAPFLAVNLKYPENDRDNGIQGTVLLTFVIEKDGSISNISTLKSVSKGCDAEAIRVLKLIPKWPILIVDDEPTTMEATFPIVFKVD